MAENHIATAEEFRQLAESNCFEPPQRVVLPKSGLAVVLRRPRPLFFTLTRHGFPQSLAARVAGTSSFAAAEPRPEELKELAEFWVEVMEKIFLEPRLSLEPGPGEISPNWLESEDATFILRWAVGEVTGQALDLAGFCDSTGPSAPGPNGGDVALPPEPTPQGDDDGSAN